jgi:hypothetical protein
MKWCVLQFCAMKFPTAGLACLVQNHVTFYDTQINVQHTYSCRNSTTHVRSPHNFQQPCLTSHTLQWTSVNIRQKLLAIHFPSNSLVWRNFELPLCTPLPNCFIQWFVPSLAPLVTLLTMSPTFLFNWISDSNSSHNTNQHSYRTYCLCQPCRTN